jgi:hypothetical protein
MLDAAIESQVDRILPEGVSRAARKGNSSSQRAVGKYFALGPDAPEDLRGSKNMPVVPTTAYAQAEDALNLVRALVNDSAGAVFTDTLLMPFLNSAYRG